MNRLIPIILGVAILAGGAYWYSTTGGTSTSISANAETTSQTINGVEIEDMVLGSADAPITVVEYASYTCPHCASFHAGTFKQLKSDYIDTGKVKFVYREVYFDRPGLWASIIARCGGQEKFFGISDMIYDQQRAWSGSGDPVQIAEALRKIGRTAGLENETLEACLADADKAQSLVTWFEGNAAKDGIRSTPSFVIDGKLHSNMSYADFSELLDGKL